MNRRLNVYKDKLSKGKRRASDDDDDDDDDVYFRVICNPFLDTTGYDVEEKTTSEKGVTADFPEIGNLGWIFDSQVKDYESLLKDRRNKMTQAFRYMLKQNSMTSSSEPSIPSNLSQDDDEKHNKQVSSSSRETLNKMDDVRNRIKIASRRRRILAVPSVSVPSVPSVPRWRP